MEHFEIEEQMDADERGRLERALAVLRAAAFAIAKGYDLCPVCLVYALADSAAEAEEKGLLRHAEETEH